LYANIKPTDTRDINDVNVKTNDMGENNTYLEVVEEVAKNHEEYST